MFAGIVTENQLDEWIRGNATVAQGVTVELVWRLVAVSCPKPTYQRFPLADSIGQPGPDGILDTDLGFPPFVPQGKSYWEIGAGVRPGQKATDDYRDRTRETPEKVRLENTFVFVTPLSGRREWPHSWKKNAQARWLQRHKKKNEWRDVRVMDGTQLVDWLRHFPAVDRWLAGKMGLPVQQVETPEERWDVLRTIGDPPPLTPTLFTANREAACQKLREVFAGDTLRLRLDTRFPDQLADFVAAFLATIDRETKVEAVGRCFIVSGPDAWDAITALQESHILVADFGLDDPDGTRLLEKAKRGGHKVIFGGMPGGMPDANRVPIPSPRIDQVEEALKSAGYKEERARALARRSGGNLNSLLRCLQNLSLTPEWAQGTDAAELAIAELLGSWNEASAADQVAVEGLLGKAHGEWIGKMREITLRPGTPLIQRDTVWKMVLRYEGWVALGPQLFDEHLDRFKEVAVAVLREHDPQFELPADERYAASIHGKVLPHSALLRQGLAESLALLGSHPRALTSCSSNKAATIAVVAVREILDGADWVLWASLNSLLPFLAEAAPRQFLDAVERALHSDPCPFDMVFSEEGSGIMGGNYMTGLLWAMETLAWDSDNLTRVAVLLGGLAARDPGGKWANRPAESLSTILLPWLPQTCAPLAMRRIAVETLLKEVPETGWKLVLSLLPAFHGVSSGARKPVWRETIPDDWSSGVTQREYRDQVSTYAELAIGAAKQDLAWLTELVGRLGVLPPPARDQVLAHLHSDTVSSMTEVDRLPLWTTLVDLVSQHRKFTDADWAMEPAVADKVAAIADSLAPRAPLYRHQRLFVEDDYDLYEEKGNYDEQQKELEVRRQEAVREVFATGRIDAVLQFAEAVEAPWRVGLSFGLIGAPDADHRILPGLLESSSRSLAQFVGGFVLGRFHQEGWQWVDGIDTSCWTPAAKGQFLAYLPFTRETWDRAGRLLGEDESPYWSKANANPYSVKDGLEDAVDKLSQYGRPYAAIACLGRIATDERRFDSSRAMRVLHAIAHSKEHAHARDVHAIIKVIQATQDDPNARYEDVLRIEWAFLPILNEFHHASPRFLEQRLANDPAFFRDVIRTVFRSSKEEHTVGEVTEQQKAVAENGYRLLMNWHTPPGSQEDGTFDGNALLHWLDSVRASSRESGHLEVALSRCGHVLVYAPADPDGLWLHRSVAKVLNEPDACEMREAFTNELFNSRGVHSVDPEGRGERELAEKYRRQAVDLETAGYHRLADSLRSLAESYDREAERIRSTRDSFDE